VLLISVLVVFAAGFLQGGVTVDVVPLLAANAFVVAAAAMGGYDATFGREDVGVSTEDCGDGASNDAG
jgi:hypothetical protein